MGIITLEEIIDNQAAVSKLIAAFELQQKETRSVDIIDTDIKLTRDERYAGIILGEEESPSYHLILLPYENNKVSWTEAQDWAAKVNGVVPTRRELRLLFVNLSKYLQQTWYWSSDEYVHHERYAWVSNPDGLQDFDYKPNSCHARAVRRVFVDGRKGDNL